MKLNPNPHNETMQRRWNLRCALFLLSIVALQNLPETIAWSFQRIEAKRRAERIPQPTRRAAILSSLSWVSVSFVFPALAQSDGSLGLRIENGERVGLELQDVRVGNPSRSAVAIKSILPGGAASRSSAIQPGMILKGFPDAKSVSSRVKNGPYPIDLEFEQTPSLVSETLPDQPSPKDAFIIRHLKDVDVGIEARSFDVLEVEYEARYNGKEGTVFDSSAERGTGQPFQLVLGIGDVIPGLDQGLFGMKAGEIREIEMPQALGYGKNGRALFGIPDGSRLYYLVKVVSINGARDGDDRTRDEMEERVPYVLSK